MKKIFTLIAFALASVSAFAQHYEWTCAQINNNELFADGAAAVAAGYDTYSAENWAAWGGSYIAIPAQDLINNEDVVISLASPYNYATNGNGKYSGSKTYAYKLIMGMANSSRDKVDPSAFIDGMNDNKYAGQKLGDTDQGHVINPTWIKVKPAAAAPGTDATTSVVTVKVNRGNNLAGIFVVDATKQKAVIQTKIRNASPSYTDIIRFQAEPNHEYYIFSSEKNSVEFYGIEYDTQASDKYELLISEANCTDIWTCAQINNNELFADGAAAVAAGYDTYSAENWAAWGGSYIAIPAQDLINSENIKVSLASPYNYATNGNSAYGGYKRYGYKLIVGMASTSRDGIDATAFVDGMNDNKYAGQKLGDTDQGHVINPTWIKVTVPEAPAGTDAACGRLMINWSRGGNNGALYVVEKSSTDQKTVAQELGRLDNDHKQTTVLCTIVNVYPGCEYYILGSEKNSIELYGIGYCPVTSEKYGALEATTGISNVAVENATVKVRKAIVNGRIVILNGHNTYNVAGQLVK